MLDCSLYPVDEWLDSDGARRDALKFKRACDDSLDALRYCTFIQGRSCGKTALAKELARQMLEFKNGLASSDDWPPYLTRVYGEPMLKFKNGPDGYLEWVPSGSKSLKELAKKYGCDIEREEETNNMREEYGVSFKNEAGVWYKIDIRKARTLTGDVAYNVRLYKSVSPTAITGWDFIRIYFYETWEQLSTQLMCDIIASGGVVLDRAGMNDITSGLVKAKREFREHIHYNVADRYQQREKKDEVRFTAPYNAMPKIEKVIFNPPATIVQWKDGTKTVVKCQDGDEFDWEKGLAMAYVKRAFNNERTYYGLFKKNEPFMNLPNSNMKYDPNMAKEVKIIVPKELPVTGDIIRKVHDIIVAEGDKILCGGYDPTMEVEKEDK